MRRWQAWLYGALGAAGTLALTLYAASVVRFTNTPLQVALLVFTVLAATIGWLGLLVSYLTYRLEAGRVPKPDVGIMDGDSMVTHWRVQLEHRPAPESFASQIEDERRRLDETAQAARRSAKSVGSLAAMLAPFGSAPTAEDWERFDRRVSTYLESYREYLEAAALLDEIESVTRRMVLAFTNDRGGAPADGVLVRLRFPVGTGLRVLRDDFFPKEIEAPKPPSPPKPRSYSPLDYIGNVLPAELTRSITDSLGPTTPANVSPPRFGRGSIRVDYEIGEILHNVPEDNSDDPLVLVFTRSGQWAIPYEVHARNLPVPRRGSLQIEATFLDDPVEFGFGLPDDADALGIPPEDTP